MALHTDISLRNKVIYCIFVRNHTGAGTFRALEADLDRLKALGTDILWLMPIYPIGVKNRKGTLGSPYAICDYRDFNPEYGTREDFLHLVQEIHRRCMRCIIDVVYNHTSPDSVLAAEHPEFFLRDEDGKPTRKVADWWDIVDLDYTNRDLWAYQIETLCRWAEIVDGFRCDVASTVPVEFWLEAREAVERVHPGCIWLAESVFAGLTMDLRRRGIVSATDTELYRAFDLTYDYDVWPYFEGYLAGKNTLREYINMINFQEEQYPGNYVKLRFLENHDQPRMAQRLTDEDILRSWLAFTYFERGAVLLYSGSEFAARHRVTLFDADDCYRDQTADLQEYLQILGRVKKSLPLSGCFRLRACEGGIVMGAYDGPGGTARGIFPLEGRGGRIFVDLPDGTYVDSIASGRTAVRNGYVECGKEPLIFCAAASEQKTLIG